MKKTLAVVIAFMLLGACVVAQAVNIETVSVGDVGNAADTASHSGNPARQGSVGYNYNIGKYEVTAGQYAEFLNAVAATDTYGLYNIYMDKVNDQYGCNIKRSGITGSYTYSVASDYANRPVNYVSYWDTCRFANWLGNGQGTGSTETGAYNMSPTDIAANTVTRNDHWEWAVANEDEWYKAAYYDPSKVGYWDYATRSDTPPSRVMATSPYYWTVAGEFENCYSAYGTFDQDGNVYEWNEATIMGTYRSSRGIWSPGNEKIEASLRNGLPPTFEAYFIGFRVVQAVPEPSSIITLLGGLVSVIGIRKRRV